MRKGHVINGQVLRGPFLSHFCGDQGACVPITGSLRNHSEERSLVPHIEWVVRVRN